MSDFSQYFELNLATLIAESANVVIISESLCYLDFKVNAFGKERQHILWKGRCTRSNFWSQLILRFKEVSDANQQFYQLKQCRKKQLNPKNGWCKPTLTIPGNISNTRRQLTGATFVHVVVTEKPCFLFKLPKIRTRQLSGTDIDFRWLKKPLFETRVGPLMPISLIDLWIF